MKILFQVLRSTLLSTPVIALIGLSGAAVVTPALAKADPNWPILNQGVKSEITY